MTPHAKALTATNARIERLQDSLRKPTTESEARILVQSLVVTIGLAEALNDYAGQVGKYAQRRYDELKQANEALGAEHAQMLATGQELLEKMKANPADRAIRQEIERTQRGMEAIQKNLRRGTNALQRDIGPSVAMVDQAAEGVRRLVEADRTDALGRLLRDFSGHVRDLYAAHPGLPVKIAIDAAGWEAAALSEINQAAGFEDAYARAGHQATFALELMAVAVSENPPGRAEEATRAASAAAAARIKGIMGRFPTGDDRRPPGNDAERN